MARTTQSYKRSIAKRALTLGVAPALCILLLVSATFVVASFVVAQRSLARDMDALAAVIRDNVSASLAFDDRKTATEVLRALRAKRNVDGVCVFNMEGKLFAAYARSGFRCAPSALDGINTGRLIRAEPVSVENRRVGLVQLVGNDSDLYDWMTIQGIVTAAALAFGAVIAFVLARRMQRSISQPVLDLATSARQVTATGDYTVRAPKSSDDEIGALADAFNTMLEQIQHQSRLKDEFLAALSHELRTPLNAILGWLQLVRATRPDGERLERALSAVERNARAQARLVEDLLDVSRIVTGKLQLTREAVDLREVVAAALDSLAPIVSESGVSITSRVPHTPCMVSGDRERLRQLVVNLLANSLKFTPSGGTASVELGEERDRFVITVTDTGIGIVPEFLPHVFDRFRQFDGSTTRAHGGLGLGLAIVKEITELHGGAVTAESEGKGKGARFAVRLPELVSARTLEADPRRRKDGVAAAAHDVLAGIRVLAVDDNPDALEILGASLRGAGASVDIAGSAEEVFRIWRPGFHQVLVCDLAMPYIDGFGVLDRVHDMDPEGRVALITVAVTAHTGEDMRQRSLAAGFDAHVTKPFDADALVSLIATLISTKAHQLPSNPSRDRAIG